MKNVITIITEFVVIATLVGATLLAATTLQAAETCEVKDWFGFTHTDSNCNGTADQIDESTKEATRIDKILEKKDVPAYVREALFAEINSGKSIKKAIKAVKADLASELTSADDHDFTKGGSLETTTFDRELSTAELETHVAAVESASKAAVEAVNEALNATAIDNIDWDSAKPISEADYAKEVAAGRG